MESQINVLLAMAVIILPFVLAFVQAIKKSSIAIANKYLPIVSVIIGGLLGIALFYLPNVEYTMYQLVVAGVMAGLASSGSFDLVVSLFKQKTE